MYNYLCTNVYSGDSIFYSRELLPMGVVVQKYDVRFNLSVKADRFF